MAYFRCLIRGEGFSGILEGRGGQIDFYVNRPVEAGDAEQARRAALDALHVELAKRGWAGKNRIYRLYREEGLTVRKRRASRCAVGTRAPILVEPRLNARWSLDFVHDQFACGRRFRILNIADDVTRECLAAIPDTSISGKRVARALSTLIRRRRKPGMIVSDHAREKISSRARDDNHRRPHSSLG